VAKGFRDLARYEPIMEAGVHRMLSKF